MAKLVGNGSVAGVKSKEAAMIMAVQEVGWGCPAITAGIGYQPGF